MTLRGALLSVLVLVVSGSAFAETRYVASRGIDGPSCGGNTDPCRTLTVGMANAADGDTIEVGPGRYGDLNGNNTLGEAEEEAPGAACACVLWVTRPLVIVSRGGADTTVIEAGGQLDGVRIDAKDVTFGQVRKGFTVRGAASTSASNQVKILGPGASVAGNLAIGTGVSEVGFRVQGVAATLVGNTAIGNADGFFFFQASVLVAGNRAIGNTAAGFADNGAVGLMSGNIASGSPFGRGFDLGGSSSLTLIGNVATGNGFDGLRLRFGSFNVMRGNSFVGNAGAGIRAETAPLEISGNNIFGNDPTTNCGLVNATGGAITAAGNFWGASSGPGANPADAVCDETTSATTFAPVATREIKLKLKAPK